MAGVVEVVVVVAAAGTEKIPEIAAAAEAEIVFVEAETVAVVVEIAAVEVEIAVVEAGIAVEVETAVVASLAVFWGQSLVLLVAGIVELAVGIAVEAEFG